MFINCHLLNVLNISVVGVPVYLL